MKNVSIQAILRRFMNKTFQAGKSQDSQNVVVLIKIKICEIYDFLLNLRREFLLSNAYHFFLDNYLPQLEQADKIYASNRFSKPYTLVNKVPVIFPEIIFEAGETKANLLDKQRSRFRVFDPESKLGGFDAVLGKSFLEILMIGFYFAKDSKLQTAFL